MYAIKDLETGSIIEMCETYEEAIKGVGDFEEEDKRNGLFIPDYYEIVEW